MPIIMIDFVCKEIPGTNENIVERKTYMDSKTTQKQLQNTDQASFKSICEV